MAHRTEPLKDDQAEKKEDDLVHPAGIVLDGNDIPEYAGKAQQCKIDGGDHHDQQAGRQHAGEIGLQEGTEACKYRHGKEPMLEDAGAKNQ